MSKKDNINKLTNFLALSIVHKVGYLLKPQEPYADKYEKEYSSYFRRSLEVSLKEHWNNQDKVRIKEVLKRKLMKNLEQKPFLNSEKFGLVDEEVEKTLKELNLL